MGDRFNNPCDLVAGLEGLAGLFGDKHWILLGVHKGYGFGVSRSKPHLDRVQGVVTHTGTLDLGLGAIREVGLIELPTIEANTPEIIRSLLKGSIIAPRRVKPPKEEGQFVGYSAKPLV
jgi:hypothetical protein